MDPLTVLGLVSNIVQLVDASSRAATACYQIYKDGASLEDLRIAEIADHLQQCYEQLDSSLKTATPPAHLQSGINLQALSAKCVQSAQTLSAELVALRKSPGGGRIEAVSKFLRTKRKAKSIKELRRGLDEYQKTLRILIQVDMRYETVIFGARNAVLIRFGKTYGPIHGS
jgi:hypothetical protein